MKEKDEFWPFDILVLDFHMINMSCRPYTLSCIGIVIEPQTCTWAVSQGASFTGLSGASLVIYCNVHYIDFLCFISWTSSVAHALL